MFHLAGLSYGFTWEASRKLHYSLASSYLNFWCCLIGLVNAISHHVFKSQAWKSGLEILFTQP